MVKSLTTVNQAKIQPPFILQPLSACALLDMPKSEPKSPPYLRCVFKIKAV